MIDLGNYNGGKGTVFRHIINEMPPHTIFVAPFVGGGSVTLNKRPAQHNILIDRDPAVIAAWWDHLAKSSDVAVNIANYDETAATSHLTMGAAIVTSDDGDGGAASLNPTIPADLAIFSDNSGNLAGSGEFTRAHHVTLDDGTRYTLIQGNALAILPRLALPPSTLIYCDPPYLYTTRTCQRPLYTHEMGTPAEHQALIGILETLNCHVMLSGYWSKLYEQNLADWRHFSFPAYDRANKKRQEYVWCNFSEPQRLHDYQWLGNNFRERERIGRKANRWVNRFQSLPVLERRRILAELEAAGVLA